MSIETVVDRFTKYVKHKTDDKHSQLDLSDLIIADLLEIDGNYDIYQDNEGQIYCTLPATEGYENCKSMGLMCHLDIFPNIGNRDEIEPTIITYSDTPIHINDKIFSDSETPKLNKYKGQSIIINSSNNVLGADDKAGIAEVMTALDYIVKNNIPHSKIVICFTTNEELGEGLENFDINRFDVDYAYTIDGEELGSIGCENFYAGHFDINIKGIKTHLGFAKDQMINALHIAHDMIEKIPYTNNRPENTNNYEGFFHISKIEGNESSCNIKILIRSFIEEDYSYRKEIIFRLISFYNSMYSDRLEEMITYKVKDDYKNMHEIIKDNEWIVNKIENAFKKEDIKCYREPIRGGTDGASLTFMGVPCPNISTGGVNFHSIHEFIPEEALEKMVKVIINLIKDSIN